MTAPEQWVRDVAGELSRLGEAVAEGDYTPAAIRDRLWAISGRIDPYDPQDQVRRVALVVFAEAKTTSDRDASQLAVMAVRHALPVGSVVEARPGAGQSWPVKVGGVMEVGEAAGNGYLWTRPTGQAWRYSSEPMWDGQMPTETGEDRPS